MNYRGLVFKILSCKNPCRILTPLAGYLYPPDTKSVDVFLVGVAPSYKLLSSITELNSFKAWDPQWNKFNRVFHEIIRRHFKSYYFTNLSKCPLFQDNLDLKELKIRWERGCRRFFYYELKILDPKIIFLMGEILQKFFNQKSSWWFDQEGRLYYVIRHPSDFKNLFSMETYYNKVFGEIKRMVVI